MESLSKYFPFLLTIAPILAFWSQIKSFLLSVFRFFYKQRNVPVQYGLSLCSDLIKEYPNTDFDNYIIDIYTFYSKKQKRNTFAAFKMSVSLLILYKNILPVFVSRSSDGGILFKYLKGTFPFEEMLASVIEKEKHKYAEIDKSVNRFHIETFFGRKSGQDQSSRFSTPSVALNAQTNQQPFTEPLFYTNFVIENQIQEKMIGYSVSDAEINFPDVVENKYKFTKTGLSVLSKCEKWLNSREWYQKRNITWKRGFLLHGKPGNGKSSLVLEVAKKLKIPIYILDLSSMSNEEFEEIIDKRITCESSILLIEDIDNIFDKRTNITRTQNSCGLTFDFLLNKISGVNSIQNKLLFITTNHIDKIDEALIRPGRIDEIVELQPLNYNEKLCLAENIINNDKLIPRALEDGKDDTTAEFENRCIRIATDNFWNKTVDI